MFIAYKYMLALIPSSLSLLVISCLFAATPSVWAETLTDGATSSEFEQLFDESNDQTAVADDINELIPDTSVALEETSNEAVDTHQSASLRIAQAHLDMVGAQVNKITAKKGFFDGVFQSTQTPFEQEMMHELNEFISIYGEQSIAAQAYDLKATLYQYEKNEAFALVALFHHLYIYGVIESDDVIHRIQSVLPEKSEELSKLIDTMLEKASQITGNQADRWLQLLQDLPLLAVEEAKFNQAIALSAKQFIIHYSTHPQVDLAQTIYADHSRDDSDVAIFQYQKLLVLYPDSIFRPNSFFGIANIQRTELKDYEGAVTNYKKVIDSYPDSTVIKPAYEFLALTYNKHLKDYSNALLTLQAIIDKFDNDPVVMRALWNQGDILNKKVKQYTDAVASYRKLATMFVGSDGLEALHKADKIASSKLKNNDLIIEINKQIVHDYRKHEDAPKSLFKIAEIYQKKKNDMSRARKVYEYLIKQYPNSSSAKKASRNIEKMLK